MTGQSKSFLDTLSERLGFGIEKRLVLCSRVKVEKLVEIRGRDLCRTLAFKNDGERLFFARAKAVCSRVHVGTLHILETSRSALESIKRHRLNAEAVRRRSKTLAESAELVAVSDAERHNFGVSQGHPNSHVQILESLANRANPIRF